MKPNFPTGDPDLDEQIRKAVYREMEAEEDATHAIYFVGACLVLAVSLLVWVLCILFCP
jgi:hypothetical protein